MALNHCMFSQIGVAHFVAVFDTDEFFMPGHKTPDSLGITCAVLLLKPALIFLCC